MRSGETRGDHLSLVGGVSTSSSNMTLTVIGERSITLEEILDERKNRAGVDAIPRCAAHDLFYSKIILSFLGASLAAITRSVPCSWDLRPANLQLPISSNPSQPSPLALYTPQPPPHPDHFLPPQPPSASPRPPARSPHHQTASRPSAHSPDTTS
jgi:hypothetical protein